MWGLPAKLNSQTDAAEERKPVEVAVAEDEMSAERTSRAAVPAAAEAGLRRCADTSTLVPRERRSLSFALRNALERDERQMPAAGQVAHEQVELGAPAKVVSAGWRIRDASLLLCAGSDGRVALQRALWRGITRQESLPFRYSY